jgi:hypothetical protein
MFDRNKTVRYYFNNKALKGFVSMADIYCMENNKDRRKNPRVSVYNPISYVCKDAIGNILEQNIGVVRDVSQSGIQIETFQMIQSKYIFLIFVDTENKQVEAQGETVYCKKIESGKYRIGIRLQGLTEAKLQFLRALIKSYHYQKEATRLNVSSR